MLDNYRRVRLEFVGTLKLAGLALSCSGLPGISETFVDFLKEIDLIVQRLKIDTPVGGPRCLIGNGVPEFLAVDSSAAVPAVRGVIAHIAGEVIEESNLIERSLILPGEGLVICPRRAERLDALPYRILPLAVFVGEKLAVDSADGFFDARRRIRRERQRQRFGEIPCHLQLAVPQPVFAHRHRKLEHLVGFRARLLLVIAAVHRR